MAGDGIGGSTLEDFLAQHPPFQALTPGRLAELAATASVTTYRAGATVVGSAAEDIDAVWMVRSGSVVLLHPDDVDGAAPLDTVGVGGLFGFSAMLVGTRTTFAARAVTGAVVVRLPGPMVAPHFAEPAGIAYLAQTISRSFGETTSGIGAVGQVVTGPAASVSDSHVGALVRTDPVTVPRGTSIRDAVCLMTERSSSYVVVPLGRGRLGIFTDRDLRTRVVAAGVSVDSPVDLVMSSPAYTVDADRTAAGVLLDMLERGLRHMPVVDVRGALVGVLDNADLLANATTRSFSLRRRIATADRVETLVAAAADIDALVIDMTATGTGAGTAGGILSVVVDAVVRRAVELALTSADQPVDSSSVAWLSLGSIGRREAMPSSDVDSALSWSDDLDVPATTLRTVAAEVHRTLDRCGLPADTNNAVASSPRFSRSALAWRDAARGWLDDPMGDRGLIMSSLLVDGRVVWGNSELHTVPDSYRSMAVDYPDALRLQLRDALATRARVRSLRDVLARRGNTVDLKTHAVAPIVNLARWGGLSVGVAAASTPTRLHAAAGNGLLSGADARILTDVFESVQQLRLTHQVAQLTEGRTPGDVVMLGELAPFERSVLMDSIREIGSVQRRVGYVAGDSGVPMPPGRVRPPGPAADV